MVLVGDFDQFSVGGFDFDGYSRLWLRVMSEFLILI